VDEVLSTRTFIDVTVRVIHFFSGGNGKLSLLGQEGHLMRRSFFVAIIVVVPSLATAAAFAVAGGLPEKSGNTQLDQVQQLLRRVEKLEARIAELEQLVPRTVTPVRVEPPAMVVPPDNVPKGWVPKEINGMRYYIIPLSTSPHSK
jgi:hypothetical protein